MMFYIDDIIPNYVCPSYLIWYSLKVEMICTLMISKLEDDKATKIYQIRIGVSKLFRRSDEL